MKSMKQILTPLWNGFAGASPVLATKILYRRVLGKRLNLKDPQTFNEKQQWLKLYRYRNNDIVVNCSDKYRVREYLDKCGCLDLANELYGVWDKASDIDWEKLPSKFVLKCNHGSGFNIICRDKESFDMKKACEILDKWISHPYGRYSCEIIYEKIKRKIICERFIETDDGKEPNDYKFFCSFGDVKFIYVMLGHDEVQDYFTLDWEWMPIGSTGRPHAPIHMVKPDKLEEMIRYASILSKPFPEVRVDFYCEHGKILVGELTFLTTGGLTRYDPPEADLTLGKLFPPISEM